MLFKKIQTVISNSILYFPTRKKSIPNDESLRKLFFRKYNDLPQETKVKLTKDLEDWENEK